LRSFLGHKTDISTVAVFIQMDTTKIEQKNNQRLQEQPELKKRP